MTKSFLHYWVPATADREHERGVPLNSIGSEQLTPRKVQPGDTIWIVTVADGRLFLLGRLIAGEVLEGRDAAIQRLGTDDLWEAQYTVVAEADTEERLDPVDVSSGAAQLRFQSRAAPTLTLIDGRVNAQQLQATRLLTAESAALLEEWWTTAERAPDTAGEAAQ